MTKGSDLLVTALENEGVERIFGIPGEENLHVVESLRKSKIELYGFLGLLAGLLVGCAGAVLRERRL